MTRKSGLSKALGGTLALAGSLWLSARLVRARDEKNPGAGCWAGEKIEMESRTDISSADGTAIHAEHAGEGPTVFLVHGITCNGSIWRYQVPYLARRYRVVTLDLRGHGRSGIPRSGDHSTERLTEDLEAVVEAYGPQEFALVGHSMGGFTIFKWLERFHGEWRGRLKGLAIINSSALPLTEGIILGRAIGALYPFPLSRLIAFLETPRPVAQRMADIFWGSEFGYLLMRYIAFGKRPPAREVEFQREMTASTPLHCFARSARACLEYRVDPSVLEGLEVPVLVVSSSEDRLISESSSRRTSQLIPGSRLVTYRDIGHDTLLECPGDLNRELEDFLASCFGDHVA